MTEIEHRGGELELFAEAHHWKRYLARALEPHIEGSVLEVGAGIGGTSVVLSKTRGVRAWTGMEPDPRLRERLEPALARLSAERDIPMRAVGGTLSDLEAGVTFDTILYVDVLEHIEDDAKELAVAVERLRPGGRTAVLAPAHPWLYSAFDRQVGHWRRYDRKSLAALDPAGAECIELRYLDSLGLLASLGNRLLLRAPLPTLSQILFWDRVLVRGSRLVDPLFAGRVGKSILGVWQRGDP